MGNMTRDGVHNLDLSYNYLNLVKKVTQSGSTLANYRYLWDGTKVSATNGAGNGLLYQGSLVYNKQGAALSVESISFSGGRIVATNNGLEAHYFITDHLGSVRVVLNSAGAVQERNDYYPYGMRWNGGELSDNRYRYNGKEEQKFVNLPYNDHGARMYDPRYRLSWNGSDKLADDYYPISPSVFCNSNPINVVDPDGCSTWVLANNDGTYRVVGGDVEDEDMNIYVYSIQDGNLVRGNSIGATTSITSFYNSDKDGGTWATGSIINPNDTSGSMFLDDIAGNNPPMFDDYMVNARNGGKYDFKVTNGTNQKKEGLNIYRGMPIGSNESGQTVYSSARDIGNMAAGYVAGSNGMSWSMSRLAFDAYQSKVSGKFTTEGISTQNAEYYGWKIGNSLPARRKLALYGRSVAIPILKAEYRIFQYLFK